MNRRTLEKLGIIVETAEDGVEALEKLKHGKFDFVLLDAFMPKIDGSRTSLPSVPSTSVLSYDASVRSGGDREHAWEP